MLNVDLHSFGARSLGVESRVWRASQKEVITSIHF